MCVNQSKFQSHAEPMQSMEQQTQSSRAKALKMKVLVEPLLREDETAFVPELTGLITC